MLIWDTVLLISMAVVSAQCKLYYSMFNWLHLFERLIYPVGLSQTAHPLKPNMNLFSVKAGLRHESCERILLAILCVGSMFHFNHIHYSLYPSLQIHC